MGKEDEGRGDVGNAEKTSVDLTFTDIFGRWPNLGSWHGKDAAAVAIGDFVCDTTRRKKARGG